MKLLNETEQFILNNQKTYIKYLNNANKEIPEYDALLALSILFQMHKKIYDDSINKYNTDKVLSTRNNMFAISKNYLIWELLFHDITLKLNACEIYGDIVDHKLLDISEKEYEIIESIFHIKKIINLYMQEIEKTQKTFDKIYEVILGIIDEQYNKEDYNFKLGKTNDNYFKVMNALKNKLENNEIIMI